jgi:tetratricopeptide (TPR) repeat protein
VRAIHSRLTAYLEDVRGIAHYHQGQIARAERHFRQSKYHAKQCNDERAIAIGAVHLAAIYKNTARLDEAWLEYAEAKQLFEGLGDRRQTAWVNRKLGTWYLFQGDGKNAVELLEASLKQFKREGETYEASHAHASLGWAYGLLGRWDDAVEQYRTALALTTDLNHKRKSEGGWDDTYNLSRCHLYLGDSLRQIGQLAEAKDHLELARNLIDEKVDEQYERGRVYLCLAKLYHQIGETHWAEAVRLAERSRDFHIARGNQMKLAQSLCHLGRIYTDLGQYDEAEFCYADAISMSREPGVRNSYYEVTAMVNLCELHTKVGKLDMAEDLSREAEKRCKECEYYQHLARLKVVQAEIASGHNISSEKGEYDRAVGYCKEAYRNAYHFNQYLADEIHGNICYLATKTMQVQGLAFGQQLHDGLEKIMAGGGWYLTLNRESQEKFQAQVSDLQRKVFLPNGVV